MEKIEYLPNGLAGEELKAWRTAGRPEIWPEQPPQQEQPQAPEKQPDTPAARPPSPFYVAGADSLYIKVFVEINGVLMCIRGEMDRITNQCNVESISVPLKLLEPTLQLMHGKSLIKIIYESKI